MSILKSIVPVLIAVFALAHCAPANTVKTQVLAEGLEYPWGLAFLPNGDILVTEKAGRLRLLRSNGELSDPIEGIPEIYYAGQGGMLDVLVDQDFATNQRIFLSYAFGDGNENSTQVAAAELIDGKLENLSTIFSASPIKERARHYGGRLAQFEDGTLLLSVGDGGSHRDHAQQLDSHLGKIVRINPDGSIPQDNPWIDNADALPEIWSMGHRNPQALLITPDGLVFSHEHGPQGGDEINLVKAKQNYGWPVVTRGREYNDDIISELDNAPGMTLPIVDWTPSIAPSGMTYYQGQEFPEWQGDLLAVSLKQNRVRRIDLENGQVISDQAIWPSIDQSMRDIRTGPDGAIYILTDEEDGKILRISARK